MLRQAARDFHAYIADVLAPPDCRGTRDVVALFSVVAGAARVASACGLIAATGLPVNIMSSELYGALLLLVGLGLFATGGGSWRCHWHGQAFAAAAAGLWLLLSLDVLDSSLISGINAFIIAALAANEVRVNGC